jgi:hypothetical protein
MQRAILLAAALTASPLVTAADLQPGKYRITGKLEGIPENEQTKPEDKCVTQKDIDSGLTQLGVQEDNKSCKVSDFKRSAGTISYRTTCKEGVVDLMTDVKGTFAADRFDLRMVIKAGKESNILLVSGKRLGAC